MSGAQESVPPADEYHSYVLRVRAQPSRAGSMEKRGLAIRVQDVNKQKAIYFTELAAAFAFIADSVSRDVLDPHL
jgi:hypothetical protein